MPKAKTGNFTLKNLATKLTAERCTHRFLAFQRSGQYSEIRILQTGKMFKIVGYKWPSKSTRRKLGIGKKNKKNPNAKGAITPNQVVFSQYGKNKIGWINRETPTQYQITYKKGFQTRTVWRKKNLVTFQLTDKKGKVRNSCPKTANPGNIELDEAISLSSAFHGYRPRHIRHINIDFPRALMQVGECAQVNYISDKFDGKVTEYYHKFEKPCLVFAGAKPQKDGDHILIIKGGFEITERGIIG